MRKLVLCTLLAYLVCPSGAFAMSDEEAAATYKALVEKYVNKGVEYENVTEAPKSGEFCEAKEEPSEDITVTEALEDDVTYTEASPVLEEVPEDVVFRKDKQINRRWSFEAGGWKSELDGYIQIAGADELEDLGRRIKFDESINFDKENIGTVKFSRAFGGKTTLELSYAKHEHDGILSASTMIEDVSLMADAKLELTNEWIDMAFIRELAHSRGRSSREDAYLSGVFGIKANKTKVDAHDPSVTSGGTIVTDPHSEQWDETFPIPYLGVEAGYAFNERVWLKGSMRYFKLDYDDYEAEHHDYSAELSCRLNDSGNQDWFITAGYRNVEYDVTGKGDAVLLKYKGPIVGVEVQF